MSEGTHPERGQAQDHAFEEELNPVEPGPESLTLDNLRKVKLTITADLGQCTLTVRDILALKEGSVLPMNKLAGEMADIRVNGLTLARGEVVVLVDSLHVRVAEIAGMDEYGLFSTE